MLLLSVVVSILVKVSIQARVVVSVALDEFLSAIATFARRASLGSRFPWQFSVLKGMQHKMP